jgi:DNA-binding SARP family transcriptional activator
VDNNAPHRAAVDANRRLGEFSEGSSQTMNNYPIAFQVLGPTEARQSGLLIPLSGARRRALVTRLLLSAGRAVSAETLLEDVWDGQIPSAASATLQSHVSQLRKVLGDRLQRSATGYVLRLDAAMVDAAEFEVGVASGASRMAAGDAQAAAGSFRDALRLWRGRALQDVADRPWAQPEAERLDELRRVAFEQLLQARLGLGEHEQVVADAEAAVEENPLREQRWATLILALYRCGRQADALRAYERLRNLLCDEFGIDPSPSVSALESAVLRQDPALELSLTKVRLDAASASEGASRALARARGAVDERDWYCVYEQLSVADEVTPLGAADLELLGDAAFMVGQQQMSIAARQRAHVMRLHSGDRPRAAVDAFLIVGNHYVRNRPALAAGWFHRGRRFLEDEPEGPAHGVLAFTAALIALAQGEPTAAAIAAADSQRIGGRFNEPDIEAVGQTLHACSLMRLGRLVEGQAMLDETLAWASSGQLGPIAAGQIFCWSTQALLAIADFERAIEWVDAIESSDIGGIPCDCRVHRAQALRALGRYDEAVPEAVAGRTEIEAIDLLHAGIAHYELGMIHLVHHEFEIAERSFRHAQSCGASGQPGLALLEFARGNAIAAVESIRGALEEQCEDELRRVPLLSAAVQIFRGIGDEAETARHVAKLEGISRRFGSTGLLAASIRSRSSATPSVGADRVEESIVCVIGDAQKLPGLICPAIHPGP